MVAAPVTFEFFAGGEVVAIGHALAGACARGCIPVTCAHPERIQRETIDQWESNFAIYAFDTLACELRDGSTWLTN